jgi:hypothetical protein
MAAFYRQFDWPEAPTSVSEHVVFQCSHDVVLSLFPEPVFEARFGRIDGLARVSLTAHVEDGQRSTERIRRLPSSTICGIDQEPTRSGWGYGCSFRDPEGNIWGIADKFGSQFDDRGRFIYP